MIDVARDDLDGRSESRKVRCYDTERKTMDSSGLITLRSLIFSFLFRSKYEGYKAARPTELSPTFRPFDAQPGTPVFSMPFYRHQSFRGRDTTEQFPAGGVWVMNL